jgi:thiosulfate dehydrogenase [quinone] large subunit
MSPRAGLAPSQLQENAVTAILDRPPASRVPLDRHDSTTARLLPAGTARSIWAVTRLCLGWTFLWPFLDKMFGLGHETPSAKAWIHGGSPTTGFLTSATGPFAGIYHSIAGAGWADWGFMLGLLAIGVSLLLGIGMRIAAIAGALLLVLMWSASLPPASNIFMDDHLIYALVLLGLAVVGAGNTLGLGQWWTHTSIVRRHPWLT